MNRRGSYLGLGKRISGWPRGLGPPRRRRHRLYLRLATPLEAPTCCGAWGGGTLELHRGPRHLGPLATGAVAWAPRRRLGPLAATAATWISTWPRRLGVAPWSWIGGRAAWFPLAAAAADEVQTTPSKRRLLFCTIEDRERERELGLRWVMGLWWGWAGGGCCWADEKIGLPLN